MISLRMRGLLAASVSGVALLAISAPVMAQTQPAPPPPPPAAEPAATNVIQEVVVTAQRRSEALQTVPIAVSAFSGDTLKQQRLETGGDLQVAVPNVSFSRGNFGGYNFQIRGIGTKLVATSADSGTSIHENSAPLTYNTLADAQFFDVERVEVLRGPQGTLYGRNATGGVVNLITAKPTDTLGASLTGEYGNYNSGTVNGYINVPLGDMFGVRVSGIYLNRDGFGRNNITGAKVDGRSLYSARATIAFHPTEQLRTYFMWEHFNEDDDRDRVGKQLCIKDTGPTTVGGVATNAVERGLLSQGCKPGSLYNANALSEPNSSATLGGLIGDLIGLTGGDQYAGKVQDPNLRNLESAFNPIYRTKSDLEEFNLDYDVAPSLTLSWLTSYQTYTQYTFADYNRATPTSNLMTPVFGGFPANLIPGFDKYFKANGVFADPQVGTGNQFRTFDQSDADSTQFSTEVRLASSFSGPLNFSIGANYLDFKTITDYYVFSNTLTAAALVGAVSPNNYIDPLFPPDATGHNYYDNRTNYHLKSTAVFGEFYYQFTDELKLTGGVRYTNDEKNVLASKVVLLTPGRGQHPEPQSVTFKEPTGRVNLDWSPHLSFTDQSLFYVSYARGYKGGGFNPPASIGVAGVAPTFAPEFVDAFEVGTKNTLAGGSLILNANAFYYNYSGYQVSQIINRTSVNLNIDAKIYGAEIESIWEPVHNLRFNANLGLLHTAIGQSSFVDTYNRTQNDPTLQVVKASDASNCVAKAAGIGAMIANGLGGTALLTVCDGPDSTGVGGFQGAILDGAAAKVAAATGLDFATARSLVAAGAIPGAPSLAQLNGLAGLLYTGVNLQGVPANLKDNKLPNAPSTTFSLGAQYTFDLSDDWAIVPRVDFYAQSSSFSRIFNTEADKLKAYSLTNLSLTARNANLGLNIQFYVKNVFDKTVITDTYLTDDSSGLFQNIFLSDPRLFGVSVTKTF